MPAADDTLSPDSAAARGPSASAGDVESHPEVVTPDSVVTHGADSDGSTRMESITEPAKVMRIGSMVKQLLEEVRTATLDEASRERLAEVYERSIVELSGALSPDLQEELRMLSLPFDDDTIPSDAELRVAKAQLVGWLEGLFHGIQATLMAQQFAAQQQIQQMRQLPGQPGGPDGVPQGGAPQPPQTGTYL